MYDPVKAMLQAMKNRDRAEIIRMVGTRYSTPLQKKGSQRSSRPPEQACCFSESGGRGGARRGRGRGCRGTRIVAAAGTATTVNIAAAEKAAAAPRQ